MIGVIALSHEQARFHAREMKLGKEGQDWVAITSPNQVRGCRLASVKRVGQWYKHPRIDEIESAIEPALKA